MSLIFDHSTFSKENILLQSLFSTFSTMKLSTLVGCGIATFIGFTINKLVARWVTAQGGSTKLRQSTLPARIFAQHLTSTKSPLWTWFLSIIMSSLVYPSCFCIAVFSLSSTRTTGSDWIQGIDSSSIDDDRNFGLRLFLYSFFGYAISDIPNNMDSYLFLVHHICCLIGILCTLETNSSASVPAALGIFFMEEGSLIFNIWAVSEGTYFNIAKKLQCLFLHSFTDLLACAFACF